MKNLSETPISIGFISHIKTQMCFSSFTPISQKLTWFIRYQINTKKDILFRRVDFITKLNENIKIEI